MTKVHLDDILEKFGVWDRYHTAATVWLTLINVFNSIAYTNYIFITEEVKYRCKHSDNGMNISYSSVNTSHYGECQAESVCAEWVYEDPRSFVAEFDLACQEWKRTLVGTMHSFGYMVGLLIVGPLSDRLGRKTLTVVTCILGSSLGLARSFTTNYWLYVILEFLEAVVGDPCSSSFMMSIEMVATDKRVLYTTITGFGYTIGGVLYPLIYWLVPYWRHFLQAVYAPGLLFIFYIYLIDESPRWLLTKGKKNEAVTIIDAAAKVNKLQLDMDINQITYQEEKGANFSRVLLETFKSKSMLKRFFVCAVWWIASTFVNHGLTINSISLQGNKYVNYALTSLVDVPGRFVVVYILNRYKRKMPLIFTFVACAVLCAAQPFVPYDLPWLSITLFMSGKLMSSFYFSITYIFTSELFPTYTRNSMHALCSSVGRIGSIVAPQMPLLMVYWSGLPSMIFGLVSLTAGLLTLLVPDTTEDALPDTVHEAEKIGKIEENELGAKKCSS
ncbi:solute carrier family 22 member 3-like isoform X1 [Leguminivora glycinivorella]|uniref:solute carrier family 22 member 3-like isoform X1 n=2 Tax=Leguminivora glycinivorella TaxID=1035111 RepID=UPI00200DE3D9|nr:solute carrier family 22 member 3-like isoform X1 [Leguminivora glycinivorella]XP_047989894.1 solute carrier family 22 member 3-like isoform X1 [Leguminivora glycinivorella]XP_047989895.1 solute carrier family 22 member 3-like isoform X1 [Leguminivora glycinivorella]XP_047989896.1 solute carrier family 22 member 3-like isoform X1 [Leguminivora glycinivorella]XP_047989897.1 solute carrier family 22 member 3-like isoform X1 [Leguminivora glycinivorella]